MVKLKIAIVTGAGSGIGRETAILLSEKGYSICLVDKNKLALNKTFKLLSGKGHNIVKCNVSNAQSVNAATSAIKSMKGTVKILVNNAGFGIYKPFEKSTNTVFKSQINTNYLGTVYFTKALLSVLKKSKGHIVNVASMAGKIPFPNLSGYCASKFAVVGFTESIYQELKPKGIKVHLICPSGTSTNFFSNPSWKEHRHNLKKKDLLNPKEVANSIWFAIKNNKPETLVPVSENLPARLKGALPEAFRLIQNKRFENRQKNKVK